MAFAVAVQDIGTRLTFLLEPPAQQYVIMAIENRYQDY
jgi:hypothetical protein